MSVGFLFFLPFFLSVCESVWHQSTAGSVPGLSDVAVGSLERQGTFADEASVTWDFALGSGSLHFDTFLHRVSTANLTAGERFCLGFDVWSSKYRVRAFI